MSITKTQAETMVDSALGGDPDLRTLTQIVNDAGRLLCNMHRWKWLDRTEVSLDLVEDQSYVDLPSDLATIRAIDAAAQGKNVLIVNRDTMLCYRNEDRGTPNGWVVSLTSSVASNGALTERLDLYPTPSSDQAAAIKVAYRAEWRSIDGDQAADVLTIPDFLEPLFIEVLIATAKGMDDDDSLPLSARLETVRRGSVFADAVKRDVSTSPLLGYIPTRRGSLRPPSGALLTARKP